MRYRTSALWALLLVLTLASCSRPDSSRTSASGTIDSLEAVIAGQRGELDALRKGCAAEVDSLQRALWMQEYPIYQSRTFLPEHEEEELKKRGFSSPGSDLLSDLERQSDLLPETEYGLKFRFLGKSSFLLPGRRVLGYFEDGHNDGYALLSYRVGPSGDLLWKLDCNCLE